MAGVHQLAPQCTMQTYQTHIFAMPVTGAKVKKTNGAENLNVSPSRASSVIGARVGPVDGVLN